MRFTLSSGASLSELHGYSHTAIQCIVRSWQRHKGHELPKARIVMLVLCLLFLWGAQSEADLVTTVRDEFGFFNSLKNNSVTHIILAQDLKLRPEFWAQSWVALNITRNLTIQGSTSDARAYTHLDFSFIPAKAVLSADVTVTFSQLTILNALSRIGLDYDFFGPSQTPSAVVWSEVINHLLLCMPLDFAVSAWMTVPRPRIKLYNGSVVTGGSQQNVSLGTAPFCTEANQCYWPVMEAWDIFGEAERGYLVHQLYVTVICDHFATQECIDTLGAIDCYTTMLQKVFLEEQQQASSDSNGGGSGGLSDGARAGMIAGCVVGGTALVVAAAVYALHHCRLRKHHARAAEGLVRAAKPVEVEPRAPHPLLMDSDLEAAASIRPMPHGGQGTAQAVSPSTAASLLEHKEGGGTGRVGGKSAERPFGLSSTLFSGSQSRDTGRCGAAAASSDQLVLTGNGANAHASGAYSGGGADGLQSYASNARPYATNITSPFNTEPLARVGESRSHISKALSVAAGGAQGAVLEADAPSTPSSRWVGGIQNSSTGGALTTLGSALMSLFRTRSGTRGSGHTGPHVQVALATGAVKGEAGAVAVAAAAAAAAASATDPLGALQLGYDGTSGAEDNARLRVLTHTGSFKVIQQSGSRDSALPTVRSSGDTPRGGVPRCVVRSTAGSATGPSSTALPYYNRSGAESNGSASGEKAIDGELLLVQEVLMSNAGNVLKNAVAGKGLAGAGKDDTGGDGGDGGDREYVQELVPWKRPGPVPTKRPGMAVVVAGLAADAAEAAQEVMLGPLIGSGSFGKVYKGTWRGCVVAVKVISHGRLNTQASIENELRLSMSFDHRNVVRALSYITCSVDADGVPTLTIQSRDAIRSRMSLRSGNEQPTPGTLAYDDESMAAGSGGGMIGALYDNEAGNGRRDGGRCGTGEAGQSDAAGHDLPRDVAETWVIQEFMGRGTLSTFLKQGGLVLRRATPPVSGSGTRLAVPTRISLSFAPPSVTTSSPLRASFADSTAGTGASAAAGDCDQRAAGSTERSIPHLDGEQEADRPKQQQQQQRPKTVAEGPELSDAQEPLPLPPSGCLLPQQLARPLQLPPSQRQGLPQVPACLASSPAASRGSLPPPNMRRVVFCALDVARGLEYLHGQNVCHGDLKPGNILLAEDPASPWGLVAKLADFGLSRALAADKTHMTTNTHGTVSYMCPLVLNTGKVSPSSCVYSYGIILWELVSGRPPYYGCMPGQIVKCVMLDDQRPEFAGLQGVPPWYSNLAQRCWTKDAAARPTMAQVVLELEARVLDLQGTSV